jgi:predicted Zn-dependent protease
MARSNTLLLLLLFIIVHACVAQQPPKSTPDSGCALPLLSNPDNARNMFNDQQEEWLGDILDQGMRKEFHLIDDPDGYLQKIGERLLAALPSTQVHYRFVIVDSPGLNSFGLAGGRIYIYRSMIAFTKNEDELAALVGHEIGHMIMHQEAIRVSDNFRRIGIKEVTDKEDILKKWNQFQDSYART